MYVLKEVLSLILFHYLKANLLNSINYQNNYSINTIFIVNNVDYFSQKPSL